LSNDSFNACFKVLLPLSKDSTICNLACLTLGIITASKQVKSYVSGSTDSSPLSSKTTSPVPLELIPNLKPYFANWYNILPQGVSWTSQ